MAKTVADVMTSDPITVAASDSVAEVAGRMRSGGTGAVLVMDDGQLVGIVTDRDIVVRVVAADKPSSTPVREACSSGGLVTVSADTSIDNVVELMRDNAIRRVPVVENGSPVGIVSIGDLALERDPDSALADISAAHPNT